MLKLRKFLNTTTRRERFLLFVFFCFLLVFAYIQFFVKPMEAKIYARSNEDQKIQEKTYTESEVDGLIKEIQNDLASYGSIEEVSREVSEEGGYRLDMAMGLKIKEEDLDTCLSYISGLDFLQGQGIKKEDGQVSLNFNLVFPLSFGQNYWPTPQKGPEEEVPAPIDNQGIQGQKETKSLEEGQKMETLPVRPKRPERQVKPKDQPIKKPKAQSNKRPKAQTQVKAQATSKTSKPLAPKASQVRKQEIKDPGIKNQPSQEVLSQLDKGSLDQESLNPAKDIKLKNFQAFADPSSQPILRKIGSSYQFSYMDRRGEQTLYQFTFKPILGKDLKIESKSGQLGSIQVYSISNDQVLSYYTYEEARKAKDLLVYGVYYSPLPGQITDILCFSIDHEEGV